MRTRWPAVLLATGLLVVGCGSSGSEGGTAGGGASTTGATTPSPATSSPTGATTSTASAEVCADAAALQVSVDKLVTINVGRGVVTELQNDIKDVQSSLTTLVNGARSEWQDEIAALQASLMTLQTAVQALASNPSTSTVGAARTALQGVGTAARNLFAAVGADCPSVSPSPTSS